MNEAAPLVSIIIPTYKSRMTLGWALRSVLRQEVEDFEVWVVGDGCIDGSEEVVCGFGDRRLRWMNLPSNSGSQSVPNNAGIARARGRYIAHLGHDDLWLPWHLRQLVRLIQDEDADFVHSMVAYYSPKGLMGIGGAPSHGRSYAYSRVVPSSWLYRREVVDACGPWDSPKKLSQPIDVDYVRRVDAAGKRIVAGEAVTVLKYPSSFWKAYARTDGWPQEEPCRLIETDPDAVRQRIAVDMARLLASEWRPLHGPRDLRRYLYEYLRDSLLAPKPKGLEWLRHATFQYLRRRARKERGLE